MTIFYSLGDALFPILSIVLLIVSVPASAAISKVFPVSGYPKSIFCCVLMAVFAMSPIAKVLADVSWNRCCIPHVLGLSPHIQMFRRKTAAIIASVKDIARIIYWNLKPQMGSQTRSFYESTMEATYAVAIPVKRSQPIPASRGAIIVDSFKERYPTHTVIISPREQKEKAF